MGIIDLSKIHNWFAIGATAFLTIGIGMLFSKFLASKKIPVLSPAAAGVISFWNTTVAI
jgi:hypothetical protein